MSNYMVAVVVLGLALYKYFPVWEDNLLVLVNSQTVDVARLNKIQNIKAAFKVERNLDIHKGTDYAGDFEARVTIVI